MSAAARRAAGREVTVEQEIGHLSIRFRALCDRVAGLEARMVQMEAVAQLEAQEMLNGE